MSEQGRIIAESGLAKNQLLSKFTKSCLRNHIQSKKKLDINGC